jgi:hypothetical protein
LPIFVLANLKVEDRGHIPLNHFEFGWKGDEIPMLAVEGTNILQT